MFHEGWLPSEAQQLHFCRAYMAAMRQQLLEQQAQAQAQAQADTQPAGGAAAAASVSAAAGGASGLPAAIFGSLAGAGSGADKAAVEAAARLLLAKAQAQLPLVHLKWGLWGLVQDKMSDVDFDYLAYASQRIQRYHASKRTLLGGSGAC